MDQDPDRADQDVGLWPKPGLHPGPCPGLSLIHEPDSFIGLGPGIKVGIILPCVGVYVKQGFRLGRTYGKASYGRYGHDVSSVRM